MEQKKRIYADNAATTPVSEHVLAAMQPFFTEQYANPSALYLSARKAGRALADARKKAADALGCSHSELFFTSGGTEGDNWAVKETALAYLEKHGKPGHIVSTSIEHHAVLHAIRAMERLGFQTTYVDPGKDGIVRAEDMENAVRDDTCLACMMLANNEIGTVQPVGETARRMRERNIPVLCDAVQAFGQIPVDLSLLGADFVTVSGHKLHAPKGIGLLYIREGTALPSLLDGGGQESGMRSGTENTAFAVGLAEALSDAVKLSGIEEMKKRRDRLFDRLLMIPGSVGNGTREEGKRLPGNINVSFPGLDSESLVLLLDMNGVCASGGSACNSRATLPSHVLKAIGKSDAEALSSLRLTLSAETSEEETDMIGTAVEEVVRKMRVLNGEG